jgi:hypothetical protein
VKGLGTSVLQINGGARQKIVAADFNARIEAMSKVRPVPVRLTRGTIIWRHGRSWTEGELVEVRPDDAAHLIRHGYARPVAREVAGRR